MPRPTPQRPRSTPQECSKAEFSDMTSMLQTGSSTRLHLCKGQRASTLGKYNKQDLQVEVSLFTPGSILVTRRPYNGSVTTCTPTSNSLLGHGARGVHGSCAPVLHHPQENDSNLHPRSVGSHVTHLQIHTRDLSPISEVEGAVICLSSSSDRATDVTESERAVCGPVTTSTRARSARFFVAAHCRTHVTHPKHHAVVQNQFLAVCVAIILRSVGPKKSIPTQCSEHRRSASVLISLMVLPTLSQTSALRAC